MSNIIKDTKELLDQLCAFVEATPLKDKYCSSLRRLTDQVETPCVLAVTGRVKAGKSSFINALLGQDLAKTGVTETTATINIFKYGVPPSEDRPVLCVWADGRSVWETREFLDSLQGNDAETLNKARGILYLEFYVPNPILKDITLVDTPGTDAVVGEDGDAHQKITEEYLNLRKLHSDQTNEHTNRADAVIFVIQSVGLNTGQAFLSEFRHVTGGNSSCLNAIGVFAKIDLYDTLIDERKNIASGIAAKMENELNTVIPVSAGIWRNLAELKNNNLLRFYHEQLRRIPAAAFSEMIKNERAFLEEPGVFASIFKLNEAQIPSVAERQTLLGNMPWRVFTVIAKYLYQYPLDEAVARLEDISGSKDINDILQMHFFQRGRLLRCYRIANEVQNMLWDIERRELYKLKIESKLKKAAIDFLQSSTGRCDKAVISLVGKLVEEHIIGADKVAGLETKISDHFIPAVQELINKLHAADTKFSALQLIEGHKSDFSAEELSELYLLFGMHMNSGVEADYQNIGKRQQFWRIEAMQARSKARRRVAETAMEFYGAL